MVERPLPGSIAVVNAADSSFDDAVLVERCRRGDPAAVEGLVLRYQDRVYNAVLRICANPDDAAELTQETFVKVLENLEKFEGRASFYTWVFRIAVNLALNYRRRRGRVHFRSLYDGGDDREPGRTALRRFWNDDRIPDPAEKVQEKELCELAAEALGRLDEAHKAVIVLRDMENMSYSRIAEVLQIELGTVKSRLARARMSLREILEEMIK
jgi:RNA polymerase sigma-70 factor (ECF subfamily)